MYVEICKVAISVPKVRYNRRVCKFASFSVRRIGPLKRREDTRNISHIERDWRIVKKVPRITNVICVEIFRVE